MQPYRTKEEETNMVRILIGISLSLIILNGCATYQSKFVSFKPPEAYTNFQQLPGIAIAGESFADDTAAKQAFGFDIRGAGLLPVQLVMNNQGGFSLEIIASQTFLVDGEGRYWPIVSNSVAIDRLEKSTQLAAYFGTGAAKGTLLGATGGAIIGAALGIVSGKSISMTMGKGAALGAAGGAVLGGSGDGNSGERERRITDDLRQKGLEGKRIPNDHLANGFLFFPGEAPSARELKLQLRELETGTVHKLSLKLN